MFAYASTDRCEPEKVFQHETEMTLKVDCSEYVEKYASEEAFAKYYLDSGPGNMRSLVAPGEESDSTISDFSEGKFFFLKFFDFFLGERKKVTFCHIL